MLGVVSLEVIFSGEYSGMDDRFVASVGMEIISDDSLDSCRMRRIPPMLMKTITKEMMRKEYFISERAMECLTRRRSLWWNIFFYCIL